MKKLFLLFFILLNSASLQSNPSKTLENAYRTLEKGDYGQARLLFQEVMAQSPELYQPYLELGFIYHIEELNSIAIPYLQKSLKLLQKSLTPAQEKREKDLLKVKRVLASAFFDEKRVSDAEAILQKLIKKFHHSEDISQLAWIRFKTGKPEQAMELTKQALKYNPKSFQALNTYAILLGHEGKFEDSLREYLYMQKLFSDHPVILNNLAETYTALFSYEKAEQYFIKALYQFHPSETALVGINLANIYMDMLQPELARQILKRYQGTRDFGFYLLSLSRSYYLEGKLGHALALLEESFEIRQILSHIGWDDTDFQLMRNHLAHLIYDAYSQFYLTQSGANFGEDLLFSFRGFSYRLRSWWAKSQVLRLIASNQKLQRNFFVHASDSVYFYSELWRYWRSFPQKAARELLHKLLATDQRAQASSFYHSWMADLEYGQRNRGKAAIQLSKALSRLDSQKFPNLYLNILWQKYSYTSDDAQAQEIWKLSPAYAFYAGLRIPITMKQQATKKMVLIPEIPKQPFFRKPRNQEDHLVLEFTHIKDAKGEATVRITVQGDLLQNQSHYEFKVASSSKKREIGQALTQLGQHLLRLSFAKP